MGEQYLLAPSGLCLASFLIQHRTTCLENYAAHTGLGPPIPANSQDNPLQPCPHVSLTGEIPQLGLSQLTLGYIKLTNEAN